MINNVVLVSQQSDSDTHTCVFILFKILFPFRILQSAGLSSACIVIFSKATRYVIIISV